NVQSKNYAEYFNGLIDEVRISNQALTPGQFLAAPSSLPPIYANITPAPLTVTGLTANKVYDGTTTATLNMRTASFGGIRDGDTVTFATKDVGDNIPITVTGLTLGGAQTGDYTLLPGYAQTAAITPAPLTVTGITADNKTYDATTTATLNTSKATPVGVVGGDA